MDGRGPHSSAGIRALTQLGVAVKLAGTNPAVLEKGGIHKLADATEYAPAFKGFEQRVNSMKGLRENNQDVTAQLQTDILVEYQKMLNIDHGQAIEDAARILGTKDVTNFAGGGRRTRRRKTKHRKSRRRRVRGGRLEVFESLAKQGPEVERLVHSVKDHVRSDDAQGAVLDYKALIDLVGQPEAERLLKDIPPAELKKILQV